MKIDETPGSSDKLLSIEELWKAKRPKGKTGARPSVPITFTSPEYITTSLTSRVQTDSNTESSGKIQGIYWFYFKLEKSRANRKL